MLQGGYRAAAERDQLKCWVTAKLLWNPAWDERALARDFIQGHYGKAAPALQEYEDLLAQLRTEHAQVMDCPAGRHSLPDGRAFLHQNIPHPGRRNLCRARSSPGATTALLRRVERAELPILYVKCVRGPEFVGDSYAQAVADFERIARRENVQFLQEGGPDFEGKLSGYKNEIPR